MKTVKITAEITLTPEMFSGWNKGIYPETELLYQQYVENILYFEFGAWKDIGKYRDFINKTIDDNGNGLKLTVEELK